MSTRSTILIGAWVFILLSFGFGAANWVLWPKPPAIVFAGFSLLSTFGALLIFRNAVRPEHVRQVRMLIFLASGCFGCACLAIAFKFRSASPSFAAASLIAALLMCIGALATFALTRSRR